MEKKLKKTAQAKDIEKSFEILKSQIEYIQEETYNIVSIGIVHGTWWCEVNPIGHTVYSDNSIFEALDKMIDFLKGTDFESNGIETSNSSNGVPQESWIEQMVEQVAETAHEVNRAFCEATGDNSQSSWTDAPDWQKNSAINGVKHILDGIVKTPEESHISWQKEKEKTGWVYGRTKDTEKKIHPCMLPYHRLPKEQRIKDALFFAVVKSFE